MTFVGHPLDTTKVRLQQGGSTYSGTFDCIRKTAASEGFMTLYRGVLPAWYVTATTAGLRFGIQSKFNTWLAEGFASRGIAADVLDGSKPTGLVNRRTFRELPLSQRVASEAGGGAACGLVLPFIFTPMELLKCKRQALQAPGSNWQIARDVWRADGLRGLYTGHTLTVYRSTIGNASIFGVYEAAKTVACGLSGRKQPNVLDRVISGIVAGWLTWILTFPIDSAKSRQQVRQGRGAGPTGLVAGGMEVWREGSMYRGFSTVLIRAGPVHCAYVPVYDAFLEHLQPADDEMTILC
jgi:hypothetical protein